MWIIKLIGFIWPFIKEMVLGDKTVAETVHANKIKTLLLFIGGLSFLLNFIMVQRLVVLGKKHIEQKQQVKKIEKPCPPPLIIQEATSSGSFVSNSPDAMEKANSDTHRKRKQYKNDKPDYSGKEALRALTEMKEHEDQHTTRY